MPDRARRLACIAAAIVAIVALVPRGADAAPAVDFTVNPAAATVGENVTFTAADGLCVGLVLCTWTVDGATAGVGATLVRSFSAAGTYLVGLDVVGADNVLAHAERSIAVTEPPPPPPPPPPPVNQPPTISFTSSTSGLTASFAAAVTDPEGTPVTVTWTFGDGATATGSRVSRTYAEGGSYTVTATARDAGGATATDTDTVTVTAPPPPVDQPPTISFTSSTSGLTASFAAAVSDPEGTAVDVVWDFGDGATGTGTRPAHTYAKGGTYTVKATARDAGGRTATDIDAVTVVAPPAPGNHAPTVSFAYLTSGLSAAFAATTGDADGDPVTVGWQFGDGSTPATGPGVTHVFAKAGTYTVTAIARDGGGAIGTAEVSVTVLDPPPGVTPAPAPAPDPPATSTTPPATGTPAAPGAGMRRMSPFPVIRVAGRFVGRATVLTVVSVRAARTARIVVRCSGRGCPYAARTYRRARLSGGHVRTLEGRRMQPDARLELRVVQAGRIGKRTVLRFADRQAPRRTDGCVTPAGKPVRCPG